MLKFLLEKEFKQILRDPFIPRMIVIMPLMMMLVFPWAANQEVKDLRLSIVDNDHSVYSDRLVRKVTSSDYFELANVSNSNEEALKSVETDETDIILEIQPDFEKNLMKEGEASVFVSANSVNGMKGGLGISYLGAIVQDFSREMLGELQPEAKYSELPIIDVVSQNRFNPYLDYKVFMIPALMVILLTLLCGFLPALNIVNEKEAGTIEQMNVTPVGKFVFIFSKLVPYWIIGYIALTICFILASLVYGLIPAGSFVSLFVCGGIYMLVMSGCGLVVSNHSDTMQQAMFVMFFFIMLFILMSGLFTPVTSMPAWAQVITDFNPLKYFIQIMRMIFLKGSSIADLKYQLSILLLFAVFFNVWAVRSYKKSN